MSWKRVFEIVRKEFRQTLREPRMRALLLGPPLIQLIIFGYAVNLDVNHVRLAWVDHDRTPASRELRDAFTGSRRFTIVAAPGRERDGIRLLDQAKVQAVVAVLPNFSRDLERGAPTSVQVLVDGSDSNTASIVAGYAGQVIAGFSRAAPAVDARPRVWFNPDLLSRDYFVPGVIVNIITLVTIMLTAMAIVREKEIGTLEQLMVTPIRPIELMLGKTLPFAVAGLVQVALVTTVALVVFSIPLRGSLWLLLLASVLFLMTTLGIGLFVSTVSQTQQQALLGSFFFFMPAFMLSGFAFPIRNMPLPVQWLSYLDPVRYFIQIVRGLFLKGTGFEVLWPELAALAIYGSLILTTSALRFHKRLD